MVFDEKNIMIRLRHPTSLRLVFSLCIILWQSTAIGAGRGARCALLIQQADAELQQGLNSKAIQTMEQALDLEPSKKEKKILLPKLSKAYILENRYDKALPVLHQAVQADPKNWQRHLDLGLAYYKVGLTDPAIRSLRAAVQFNPDAKEALLPLGELCMKQALLDEALTYLERLIRLDPRMTQARLALSRLYEERGEISPAIQQLQEILSQQDDPDIELRLGLLYSFEGQTKESLGAYRKARKKGVPASEIDLHIGLTYWHAGDWENAEKYFTRAVEQGDEKSLPYFFRSLLRYQEGKIEASHLDAERAQTLSQGALLSSLAKKMSLATPGGSPLE